LERVEWTPTQDVEANQQKRPRTALIGALTIVALIASFVLAIMARGHDNIALVIVTPEGTTVSIGDREARELPNRPATSEGLASHYFMVDAGEHDITFKEPGKPQSVQSVTVPDSRMPVIYTLMRDTLREMKPR
jgi:hypothetical protein